MKAILSVLTVFFLAFTIRCIVLHDHPDYKTMLETREGLFALMQDDSYLILTPMKREPDYIVCGYNAHKVDPEKVEEFIK